MYALYKEGVLQGKYVNYTFIRNFEFDEVEQSIEYYDNNIILYYLYKGDENYLEIYYPLSNIGLYSLFTKLANKYRYGASVFTLIYKNKKTVYNDIDKLWAWYDKWRTSVIKRKHSKIDEIIIEERQNQELVNIIKQDKCGIRLRMYKAAYDTLTYDFFVRMYKFIEGS